MKRKASTPVEVGRFVKTTGVCPVCRTNVKLNMSQESSRAPPVTQRSTGM
ncbi:MAG: hypothetical protein GU362_03945 [Thaumarchaeota archaeon]|nr:hypothetical protein [Nitrososphaerota archaeon]